MGWAPHPLPQSTTMVDGLAKQDVFLLLSLARIHEKQDELQCVQEAEAEKQINALLNHGKRLIVFSSQFLM